MTSTGKLHNIITQIETGSTAKQAGLRSDDVILEMNRQDINSVEDLKNVYNKLGKSPTYN